MNDSKTIVLFAAVILVILGAVHFMLKGIDESQQMALEAVPLGSPEIETETVNESGLQPEMPPPVERTESQTSNEAGLPSPLIERPEIRVPIPVPPVEDGVPDGEPLQIPMPDGSSFPTR